MATYFLDSSAILKRYVTETGSSWIRQMFDPPTVNHILLSEISSVEVIAAITRRAQGGGLSISDGSRIVQEFRTDLKSDYSLINFIPAVIQQAMDLAEQLGRKNKSCRNELFRLSKGCCQPVDFLEPLKDQS